MAKSKETIGEPRNLDPGNAILLLTRQHDRAQELLTRKIDSDEYRAWQHTTMELVARAFGSPSRQTEGFERAGWVGSMPMNANAVWWASKYAEKIRTESVFLSACIDLLQIELNLPSIPGDADMSVWPHVVTVRKKNGVEIAGLVANVTIRKIIVRGHTADIEEGDLILRDLGQKVEEYEVVLAHNTGDVGTLSHIEVEVRKRTPTASAPQHVSHVIQNFHGSVGSVQTGQGSTANVTFAIDSSQLAALFSQLRDTAEKEVSSDQIVEVRELISGIEAEAMKAAPNRALIKSLRTSLGPILQGAGGNLLAAVVEALIKLGIQ